MVGGRYVTGNAHVSLAAKVLLDALPLARHRVQAGGSKMPVSTFFLSRFHVLLFSLLGTRLWHCLCHSWTTGCSFRILQHNTIRYSTRFPNCDAESEGSKPQSWT